MVTCPGVSEMAGRFVSGMPVIRAQSGKLALSGLTGKSKIAKPIRVART